MGRKDKNVTGSVREFQCPADMKSWKKRGTKRGVITVATAESKGHKRGARVPRWTRDRQPNRPPDHAQNWEISGNQT